MHHCCFLCVDEQGKQAKISIQWRGSSLPLERSVLTLTPPTGAPEKDKVSLGSEHMDSGGWVKTSSPTLPFPGAESFFDAVEEFAFYLGGEELAVIKTQPLVLMNRNGRVWQMI